MAGLTGTFGWTEIAIPRARIFGADGKTAEWKSKAVLAYQRRTHAADALIASPISRFRALIGKAAQKPCAKAHPSTASLRR
jgi:hypothetical protein